MTGSLRKCEVCCLMGFQCLAPTECRAGCEGNLRRFSIPTVSSPCPCPALVLLSVNRGQRKNRERKAQFYLLSKTRQTLKLALEGNMEKIYL